jgi:hypothetical protein
MDLMDPDGVLSSPSPSHAAHDAHAVHAFDSPSGELPRAGGGSTCEWHLGPSPETRERLRKNSTWAPRYRIAFKLFINSNAI